MTKTSSLSLVAAALVAVAGFAAPVLADEDDPMTPFNDTLVQQRLADQGYNASDLQQWNGKIRATVTADNGATSFVFFDADTLKPVGDNITTGSISNGNERVIHRDAPSAAAGVQSLTAVNQDDLD